jgi:hypothetical protein
MAMAVLLVSLQLNTYVEKFSSMNLSKDTIKTEHRWFQEETLMEDPHVIQERTESPGLIVDEVADSEPWFSENTLNETPTSIQERPVGAPYPQQSTQYEQASSHTK